MKRIIFILILILIVSENVYGQDEVLEEYISIYSSEMEEVISDSETAENIEEIIPGFDTEELIRKSVSGESLFDVKSLINRLLALLFREIKNVLKIMLYIMAISVLTSYLSALPEWKSREVSDIAFYGCYIIIAGICAAGFVEIVKCGKDAINSLIMIAKIIVPIVSACLVGAGAVVSASAFQPVLLSVIGISLYVIEKFFMPALMLFASLNIVNCLSDKFNIEKMINLVGRIIKWGISILLTIFVGSAGLQSLASGGADGISVKIAKYAASNLIPFVGGILSETVETVMSCSMVIKNAVGITGIIIIVAVMIIPLIKISACLIVLRLTSSLIQPVTDVRIVKCVSGIADAVGLVFSITLAVTVMFIIILTIMLNAGSSAIMLGK